MDLKVFHLHALSALHVGIGQAVGVVDLPIMRARASNLPIVPGSAIKGVLRDEFDGHPAQQRLFGPAQIKDDLSAHAGAIALGDAQLLILPVRSLAGVAAFVTCPYVLARYARDLARSGTSAPDPVTVDSEACRVTAACVCKANDAKVVLEDLDLTAAEGADAWAATIAAAIHPGDRDWQQRLAERFVIVADDVFGFLADTATEVRARVRIGETGTVAPGALWYEENLPAETVLWGVVAFGPARDDSAKGQEDIAREFSEGVGRERLLQIGGKATVGRGLVRFLV